MRRNVKMINCLCKKEIMSIDEFKNLGKGIKINQKYNRILITALGIALFSINVFAKGTGIDGLGWMLLNLIRSWAYWICILMCILDVVKAGIGGDSGKILNIVMKYVLIFITMYLVPSIFDGIKESFS